MTTHTFTERIAEYFKRQPGVWIDARSLEPIGGRQAWRTRVSDCRTQLGMTIENRVRTVKREGVRYRISEYLYHPSRSESSISTSEQEQALHRRGAA